MSAPADGARLTGDVRSGYVLITRCEQHGNHHVEIGIEVDRRRCAPPADEVYRLGIILGTQCCEPSAGWQRVEVQQADAYSMVHVAVHAARCADALPVPDGKDEPRFREETIDEEIIRISEMRA